MKKALQVASVASMIDQFTMGNIQVLINNGYHVDVAANFESGSTTSKERILAFKEELRNLDVGVYDISFDRKVIGKTNVKAYRQLNKLINKENYDIVHCHSPIGAAITRLAAKKARKNKTKVIYTAHGFHFYKGAPFLNWLIYYPVEKYLSKYTDVLITINQEDFERAKSFKAKKVEYLPGVGVNLSKFNVKLDSKEDYLATLGIHNSQFTILSVGELNKNKNHQVVIKALALINNVNIHYMICGKGQLEESLKKMSENLNVENQVHFLGYRQDIPQLYSVSDLFVFPSYREGLSVSLIEAMASKLPVICSKIRGNTDLILNEQGGYLVDPLDEYSIASSIEKLYSDRNLCRKFGEFNFVKSAEYSIDNVLPQLEHIYTLVLGGLR